MILIEMSKIFFFESQYNLFYVAPIKIMWS